MLNVSGPWSCLLGWSRWSLSRWVARALVGAPRAPARVSHRPWPPAALREVLQAATPEFRALIVAYLLTAQRGGDVTHFSPGQYDSAARTLTLRQRKSDTPQLLHVPEQLARIIESMRGRSAERLLVTPRGKAWTTSNAQETLAALLRSIGLPRLTLHGLRQRGLRLDQAVMLHPHPGDQRLSVRPCSTSVPSTTVNAVSRMKGR
ncbi:MAG: integrase family protein [Rhodospirillales bacterium]|nr:integrase family protein [Rhodospirillales bacterium]